MAGLGNIHENPHIGILMVDFSGDPGPRSTDPDLDRPRPQPTRTDISG